MSKAAGMLLPATSATASRNRVSPGPADGAGKDVVVVSGDGVCRAGGKGDCHPGNDGGVAGSNQLWISRAISRSRFMTTRSRYLEHQQNEQHDSGIEMKVEFDDLNFPAFP